MDISDLRTPFTDILISISILSYSELLLYRDLVIGYIEIVSSQPFEELDHDLIG